MLTAFEQQPALHLMFLLFKAAQGAADRSAARVSIADLATTIVTDFFTRAMLIERGGLPPVSLPQPPAGSRPRFMSVRSRAISFSKDVQGLPPDEGLKRILAATAAQAAKPDRDHLLRALLADPDAATVLEELGVDVRRLRDAASD